MEREAINGTLKNWAKIVERNLHETNLLKFETREGLQNKVNILKYLDDSRGKDLVTDDDLRDRFSSGRQER